MTDGLESYAMIRIQIMTEDDIDFAISLTDQERWEYLPADFRRLMAVEPEGCFVAIDEDERAGMITTISYDDYAFVGSLIVDPDKRGRGFGEALLRRALKYLRDKRVRSIELDATFPAASLYRQLGFKDKYLSLRFYLPAPSDPGPHDRNHGGNDTERITEIITRLDRRLTGLNRGRLLTHLAAEFGESIYLYPPQSPSGYARVYPRAGDNSAVGPLVAANDDAAAHIWDTILDLATDPLTIGIPETQRTAVRMVCERGFLYRPPSLRMYLGDKLDYEPSVYAIISAEKG